MSKVVIVGHGAQMEKVIDLYYFPPTTQVWGFNPPSGDMIENIDQFDHWFDVHDMSIHDQKRPWYRNFLRDFDGAVYLTDMWDDIGSQFFPRREIEHAFPRADYHCGSLDWLVSCALYWGEADEIELLGMDYGGNEPDSARACLEYWVGVAEGMGVKVSAPHAKVLLGNWQMEGYDNWSYTDKVYGYEVANWPETDDEYLGV